MAVNHLFGGSNPSCGTFPEDPIDEKSGTHGPIVYWLGSRFFTPRDRVRSPVGSRSWYNRTMGYKDSEQRKQYMKDWSRARRDKNRKLVQEYKVAKGCTDCGYNTHHAGLEFDHISNDKEYNVATLMGQDKKLWEEISKCEVVCGTCHGIRTWNRKNRFLQY